MIRNIKYFFLLITILIIGIFISLYTNKSNNNDFFISKNLSELNLITHRGDKLKSEEVLKLPSLFFFGFLNCPDICPNTLTEISNIINQLGKKSKKMNFFFVTVDPERDNVSNMHNYLSNFNKEIIGITGNTKNVKKFLKSMHVYYKKITLDKDFYTLDHSSQIFIFKKSGKFFGTISLNENEKVLLEKIMTVI